VEVAGEVALEESGGVAWALACCDSCREVVLGGLIVLAAVERDRVQCAVQLAIAAAAESVSLCLATGRGDGCDASEPGEAGF